METNNAILSIINQLKGICKKVTTNKLQKMVYLIGEADSSLGCKFGRMTTFGPYSEDLGWELRKLNIEGLLEYEYSESYVAVDVNADADTLPPLSSTARRIIEQFGSKSLDELILLATTLYIQRKLPSMGDSRILSGLKRVRGTRDSDDARKEAIEALKEQGYF
jgi:uncharacterized protein YwgA